MTDILKEIESKFGKGSIFKLGSKEVIDIPVFSTGILGLDASLGIMGFPRGRISEIFGLNGVGKSCLALAAVADAQRQGFKAAYIDVENGLNLEMCEMMGVCADDLFVSQPSNGHTACDIVLALVKSGEFGIIVIDSVAALTPKQEADVEEFGSSFIGLQARMMSQFTRKIVEPVAKNNVCLIAINQQRVDIQSAGYGDGLTTSAGKALPYAASVRIELKRLTQVKDGDETVGHNIRAKVVKNKFFAPFKQYTYVVNYGSNNIQLDELISLGVEYGFVKKGGAWFNIGEHKCQGNVKLKAFLLDNVDIYNDLRSKVIDALDKYVVKGEKRDKKKSVDTEELV